MPLKILKNNKFLILTNISTIILLIVVCLKENYIPNALVKTGLVEPKLYYPYYYWQNQNYEEYNEVYSNLKGQKKIVMFGDSHILKMHWDEFLNRTDVANRGIGKDVTTGLVHRINEVKSLNPQICFIQIGSNDLGSDISLDSILFNINNLINELESSNIKSVITSIPYVINLDKLESKKTNDINNKTYKINLSIDSLSKKRNIDFIDLNMLTSENKQLSPKFATKDGAHLNFEGYKIWKIEIDKILLKYKI